MRVTETETLVSLVTQLGLSSTIPLDRRLHVIGQLSAGNSVYIEPGDYFKQGLKKIIIRRSFETDEPVTLSVFRHYNGERVEVFTTILLKDVLEQETYNNGSSLSEVIVPHATDIWELYVPLENPANIPEGTAMQLVLEPGSW